MLKGKNLCDLDHLNMYSYPNDLDKINIEQKDIIRKIIYGHDHGSLINKSRPIKSQNPPINTKKPHSAKYVIDDPIPQTIEGLNLYTTCINGRISLGLVFDEEDNPYDYKEILLELLHEYLNIESSFSFQDEIEIENLLISLFIGIRRFGDEVVDKKPQTEYHYQEQLFVKVFLFGVQEVGKTSMVRRMKTGKFNDNYFTPTRKFNIEYVKEEEGFLAIWDMPGQRAFRKKWLLGLQDSNILIYMIDVSNQLQFEESKREFWRILNRYELKNVPLIILGNKIDLMNHSNGNNMNKMQLHRLEQEIFDFFEFDRISGREWKFLFTSVKTGYNIDNVLNTVFKMISSLDLF
ncbi:MAG: GTP-binding protein [Candidatus Lokiarchaeota archaeon]|nr:GTP-binding protein [Candidatus Lokiarchaeota archaeon]